MDVFTLKNLTFSYPTAPEKLCLDHIDLTIHSGEYIALCGRSGSGKTTLLRHLKSVLTPHGQREGSVLFCGTPLEQVDGKTQASRIGYVMQDPDSQIVTDKVWHELAFGLESIGCDEKTMRLRVAEMASYFGIGSWFHRDVAELSGGQKQLLNLASIMAMQPEVLILDEPTSQLDPIAAADFLNTVKKINRELGTTVIITEHRLEDVLHRADRMVVMERGRIVACDTPRKVGQLLHAQQSPMFAAMPAPMQAYYGAGEQGEACPLTVREGRTWLSAHFADCPPAVTALPEEASLPETYTPAVSIKELYFRYEKDAPDILQGVTLSVTGGTLHGILGSNGAGKSTLLKSIAHICKPHRGKVTVSAPVAMLPQDPQCLFVKNTVRDDLLEMCKEPARILEIAQTCEIDHLLNAHPFDLSGGEQQRAALAKVLLTDPKVLLLDEPTKGLDNFFKIKFAAVLRRLQEQGVSILMVSHDVEFCAAYCDAVSMFFDGQILTTNTPRRFFAENSFYTTAANRMSRHVFHGAVTADNVVELYRQNEVLRHE